ETVDLRARLSELGVVALVGREELGESRVHKLVLRHEPAPLGLELRQPPARLLELRRSFFPELVKSAMALALIAELPLRDPVSLCPEGDLGAHPVHPSRHSFRIPAPCIAVVNLSSRALERGTAGHLVIGVCRVPKDPILAGHGPQVAKRRLEREPNQEVPVLRVLELPVETTRTLEERAGHEKRVERDVVGEKEKV